MSRLFWRRRGICLDHSWFCSPQCFEKAARKYFARARLPVLPAPAPRHRIPLGLLMLSRGQLTNPQLRQALEAQSAEGRGRVGRWLETLGFATEAQVTAALGLQWGCPVLPPFAASDMRCSGMLPFRLMEKFHMLPIQYVGATRMLYIAFSEGVEYTALYAIEQMLDCRTEACLIRHSSMENVFERLGHERRPGELLFEGERDPEEMARITCSYVLKLGAGHNRIVACGQYFWVRLLGAGESTDLLFLRPGLARDELAGGKWPALPAARPASAPASLPAPGFSAFR